MTHETKIAQLKCFHQHNYLVLNQEGRLQQIGLSQLDGALPVLPATGREVNGYTHAYVVYQGKHEEEPIQIIVMRPLQEKGESAHSAISLCMNTPKCRGHFIAQHLYFDLTILFSGECKSALLVDALPAMFDKPLTGIIFNLKGSATDQYRSGLPDSSTLVSFIPKDCFALHSYHDKEIKIQSPDIGSILCDEKEVNRNLFLNSDASHLTLDDSCQEKGKENETQKISPAGPAML
ncbi:hypothetical protein [Legionella fairfieldensis]|uniref:hypothetical protein n=1 Tax=Legionella fairfieldensis TaxID=45064 RepID=UPI00048F3ADB|nr:hypothetical protein [Legionella fairfieldensis]